VRTLKYYDDDAFYRCFSLDPRYPFKHAPLPYHLRVDSIRDKRISEAERQQNRFDDCLAESREIDENLKAKLNKPLAYCVFSKNDIRKLAAGTLFALRPSLIVTEGFVEKGTPLLTIRNNITLAVMPIDGEVSCSFKRTERNPDGAFHISIYEPKFTESEITSDLVENKFESTYFQNYKTFGDDGFQVFDSGFFAHGWKLEQEFYDRKKLAWDSARRPYMDLQYKIIDYDKQQWIPEFIREAFGAFQHLAEPKLLGAGFALLFFLALMCDGWINAKIPTNFGMFLMITFPVAIGLFIFNRCLYGHPLATKRSSNDQT